MSDEDKKIVAQAVSEMVPLIRSELTAIAVGAILSAVTKHVVTNVKRTGLAGNTEAHPMKEDASLRKGETNAVRNNAALMHDDVDAQNGCVKASETEAKAATSEATAAESGASAVRTKAGASDIETKALKMM